MKWLAVVLCSMVAGAVGGALVVSRVLSAAADQVQTKELVLVDAEGRPAARLRTAGAQVTFEFLSRSGNRLLALEGDRMKHSGGIALSAVNGDIVAGLQMSVSDIQDETALYLRDSRGSAQVLLGAMGDDTGYPSADWGLRVSSRKSGRVYASVASDFYNQPRAGLQVVRPDGKVWTSEPK